MLKWLIELQCDEEGTEPIHHIVEAEGSTEAIVLVILRSRADEVGLKTVTVVSGFGLDFPDDEILRCISK